MPSITSYFNPASKEHHALDNFNSLSGGEKFITILVTALVTILTIAPIPMLGLGGVAAFRALTNTFTVIDPSKEAKSQKAKTAKKAHSQFHDIFKKCSKDEAIRIIREQHPDLNAKDINGNTLIHIACMRQEFDEVVEQMLNEENANFDEKNNAGHLPILSYARTHRRPQNEQLHDKMVLKMNQTDELEHLILTNSDPDILRRAIQKLSDLGKPYKLQAFTDTTELFVVLLERAQTKDEVSNIVKYYGKGEDHLLDDFLGAKDHHFVDFLGEEHPFIKQMDDRKKAIQENKPMDDLKKAIQENTKFSTREKQLALKKLSLLEV